jgi:hypothetical protein
VIRLLNYALRFGLDTLQVDFSAYYTAGESLNAGLSPYKNNVVHDPPIWDGIDRYKYSRFLYPPLAASFFQLFALIPFLQAKLLWELISLVSIAAAIFMTTRFFPLPTRIHALLVGIFISLYWPLLIHLERGQVDALTLLLLVAAFLLIVRQEKRREWVAGVLLSIACLFKLYGLFILPFIILRRRWKVLQGFVLGVVAMLLLTFVVPSGWVHLIDYAYNHLPRIANYGDIAESNTLIDKGRIKAVLADTPAAFDTVKDGRGYLLGSLDFNPNATAIEPLQRWLISKSLPLSVSVLSIIVFVVMFFSLYLWERFLVGFPLQARDEFLYWQIPMIVILLAAPLTWAMNTVWLLPLIVVVISSYKRGDSKKKYLSILIIFLGLVLVMLPEDIHAQVSAPVWNFLSTQKYVFSEVIVLIGVLILLTGNTPPRDSTDLPKPP